jgi:Flp pilus assembly CpaE family ATPase
MYPLKAILIGEATKLESARQELHAHNVEIEAVLPDAAATIAWLSQAPEGRRVFIIYLAARDQLEDIRRLRGGCLGQPILGLVANDEADKEQLIQLMRAGADQVVLLPFQPADLHAALDSLAWQFGCAAGHSVLVAVVGAAPGSGVTTVAVNLACEIARVGRNCILVEASSRMGKLADALGVAPRFTTRDLATAGDRLDAHMVEQAVVPVADHLRLLAAPVDAARALDPGGELIRKLFKLLRQVAEVSILDTAYNLTETYYEGLAAVDQALVLGRHTLSGLQDLKRVCQTLRRDHAVRTLYPVVNCFDRRNKDLTLAQMQEALEEPQLLTIAFDRSLMNQAVAGQKAPEHRTSARSVLQDIESIARVILGETQPPAPKNLGAAGWLKRMFSGD